MGKFFDELFNSHEQPCYCGKCRDIFEDDTEIESFEVDVELEDPEEIINEYFELLSDADTPDDVYQLLTMIFFEGVEYGTKDELINDIRVKLQILNDLQSENHDI